MNSVRKRPKNLTCATSRAIAQKKRSKRTHTYTHTRAHTSTHTLQHVITHTHSSAQARSLCAQKENQKHQTQQRARARSKKMNEPRVQARQCQSHSVRSGEQRLDVHVLGRVGGLQHELLIQRQLEACGYVLHQGLRVVGTDGQINCRT